MSSDLPPHSNDVEEELRRVRLALDTVYAPGTAPRSSSSLSQQQHQDGGGWMQQRQLADRYLTSFQKTPIAWMVCDRLLQEGGEAAAATTTTHHQQQHQYAAAQFQQRRFFAAQTLHKKCRVDFHELPTDSLDSLRNSLLQHYQGSMSSSGGAGGSKNNNVALTTRLAMALAALSVQTGWMTVVTDLMGAYRHADETKRTLLLFFLRALPEECASDRLFLKHEQYRYEMRDQLITHSILVFEFLQETMPHDAPRVWEVLHLWIRYVPVRPHVIAESPLLPQTVQLLQRADVNNYLEPACDVVVEVLRMYPSHHPGNEDLVGRMIPLLSQLPLEQALQSADEDIQRAYCRVVTEMGESYLSWILSPSFDEARPLVAWILQCARRIEDTEIASITLHFWYRFVMDMEMIEPAAWRQELSDAYADNLLDLISVCAQHLMKYPHDETLTGDRLDDWHKHRKNVSETIEDCCRLLGGQQILQRMNDLLRAAVQEAGAGPAGTNWQGIESCLTCLCAMHMFIPSDESQVLRFVFELLPQLPGNIPPLRATASRTIGNFAEWLAVNSQYLPPLLPFLREGLSMPQVAPDVCLAIKELCAHSHPTKFNIAQPVLQLYQEVCQSGHLMTEDELHILEGVCLALSVRIRETNQVTPEAASFLESLVNPIGQRLTTNLTDPSKSSRRAVAEIDRLTIVVQHLELPRQSGDTHPMVSMLQSLWNVLDQTSAMFASDNAVAEKICRLYKHSLRSCGESFRPMLHSLMHQLIQSYQRSRQSPYLYAASICVTEYGRDPSQSQPLYDMIANLAETTFGFMRSVEDFGNAPDVMEEFYYLMDRMVNYCPEPLMRSPLLETLLQCAAMSIKVDHPGVSKGTLKFLDSTLAYAVQLRSRQGVETVRQSVQQALQRQGRPLATNLVHALMGDYPCYAPYVPDILWYIARFCPAHEWLQSVFDQSGATGNNMWPSERTRNDFMAAFGPELSQDQFRLSMRSFEAMCARERRLRRS